MPRRIPTGRWQGIGLIDPTERIVVSKLRVLSFAISIDGYGAGPNQNLENPLGVRGPELMEWFFHTRAWRRMHGHDDGETGVDDRLAENGFAGIGAWILGRNMFGPVRGPWPDESWQGWWGNEPPYHTPVFVLTHHRRPPLTMAGGTEFRFVTEGIQAALDQALDGIGCFDRHEVLSELVYGTPETPAAERAPNRKRGTSRGPG